MNSTRKRRYQDRLGIKECPKDANFAVLKIILPQLSFHDQHRLGLTCKTLRNTAEANCRAKLSYHRRKVKSSNFQVAERHKNVQGWAFYRALVWIDEELSRVRTRSQTREIGPTAILGKATLMSEHILNFGISGENFTWYPDQMFLGFNGVYKSLYTRNNSPDWRVVLNHRTGN